MIPSKTLTYWGFKDHPFADNILREGLLKLFVNRTVELSDVEDALGYSRVVGLYGGLGVGKSSFLQKLRMNLSDHKFPVAYVHLTADSEGTLYREILAELLVLILKRNLTTKRITDFKAKEEAQRLVASVTESRGSNFGGKFMGLLGGDLNEEKRNQINSHDESSARLSIRKIFDALKSPLVVILDDFEKLRYESSGKQRDYFPILSRFIGTLEEVFNHHEVSFVVSMDNHVESMIGKSSKNKEAFAFSLNKLIHLPTFELTHLRDFIQVRLKTYGWRGKIPDFIDEEAFLALAIASGSHPRRAVRVLAEAMKYVADAGSKNKRINLEAILHGSQKSDCALDVKDWSIIEYIRKGGEGSASDVGLRNALGFKKPKRQDGYHASVDRRLKDIASKLRLTFDEVPTGTTKKHVLRLPEILLD